jgi:hypothetical protein
MDDLPRQFPNETSEQFGSVDVELVRFESGCVSRNVFRPVDEVGRRGDEGFEQNALAKAGSYRSALGTPDWDVLRLEDG